MRARLPVNLLPRLASAPVHAMPVGLRNAALGAVLNRRFRSETASGELDFLLGKAVGIEVVDAAVKFRVWLDGRRLRVAAGSAGCAFTISGSLAAFLSLASRREDPDTLFFQRRLGMRGDTQTALALKNFLDAVEVDDSPAHRHLDRLLHSIATWYARAAA
ncbi:MAG: sterol-binding protein [Proteobacteria bacterium]|nr:MAG: sterol-binding protein [Pseudomonadota bacterium]